MNANQRIERMLGHLNGGVSSNETSSAAAKGQFSADAILAIQNERAKAAFDPKSMTELLFNGKKNVELFEKVSLQMARDPLFKDDLFDMAPKLQREAVYSRVGRMMSYRANETNESFVMRQVVLSCMDPSTDVRIGVHTTLFRECIHGNGTPEQCKKWLPDIDSYKLPGCFAMTELGHGSYIQGFETTATYDAVNDTFIINTPTDTATKWWIGGAAHSALAACVYARLMIDGKDCGVYPFFVPLRRREDFNLLTGVNIGDCGSKMGRHGIDNGWIQFSNVIIPRTNMLMRWAQVEKGGKFIESPLIQLSYGALIPGRVSVVGRSMWQNKKAITIAIRYGATRRQFPSSQTGTKKEEQLLDYMTHMHRLMPLLAESYAWHFAYGALNQLSNDVLAEVAKGNLKQLNSLHALSTSLKAFSSWDTMKILEECRQCLGGHGYSAYAAIPSAINDQAIQCSWEGDNTVMTLQTARYLVKCFQQAVSGKALSQDVGYFANYKTLLSTKLELNNMEQVKEANIIIGMYEYITTKLTAEAAKKMMTLEKSGMSASQAWNESAVDLKSAAEAYGYLFVIKTFAQQVQQAQDEKIKAQLSKIFLLFAFSKIRSNFATLLEDSYLKAKHTSFIKEEILKLCKEIRHQSVPLVDSFYLTDSMLRSPLGQYDGDIYTSYFNRVKNAPDSQQNPPFYWNNLIKPTLFKHKIETDDYMNF